MKQKPSPAYLVWPIILLPLSGLLIAVLALAVGLFLLRRLPRRPPQWAGSGYAHGLKQGPSLAHLVWPIALLPLSGWLTYFVASCPGNPPGYPMVWAVATYFGPPLLLAAFIVTLRFRSSHPGLSVGGAVVLASGFLAACGWGWWLFALSAMAECYKG